MQWMPNKSSSFKPFVLVLNTGDNKCEDVVITSKTSN